MEEEKTMQGSQMPMYQMCPYMQGMYMNPYMMGQQPMMYQQQPMMYQQQPMMGYPMTYGVPREEDEDDFEDDDFRSPYHHHGWYGHPWYTPFWYGHPWYGSMYHHGWYGHHWRDEEDEDDVNRDLDNPDKQANTDSLEDQDSYRDHHSRHHHSRHHHYGWYSPYWFNNYPCCNPSYYGYNCHHDHHHR